MPSAFTINGEQAENLAQNVVNGARLTFTNQANRNWVAKIAKLKYGVAIVKSSSRNQLLDPRYTVEGSHIPDRGLANNYKQYHSAVYFVERDRLPYNGRGW